MKPFIIYHVKPYERPILKAASQAQKLSVELREEGLHMAMPKQGEAEAICLFVQDQVDDAALQKLAHAGIRLIVLRSRGFDNVDLKAAKRLGIEVQNTTYPQAPIVEHTLALIMALSRKLKHSIFRLNQGDFTLEGLISKGLEGKRAGIVGTGLIGAKVAKTLMSLGMEVQAFDPYPNEELLKLKVPYLPDLESLFKSSDVISLHCPADPEQASHLIHEGLLKLMPRGAILVNTARGSLLDTQAALSAVQSGQLGGLGLDVYEHEQACFYEQGVNVHQDAILEALLAHPDIILTPHQAFLSEVSLKSLLEKALQHYRDWLISGASSDSHA